MAQASASVTLDAQTRHMRRKLIILESGEELLVDFPLARMVRDGEYLKLEDGRAIQVKAAPEELIEIGARDSAHLTLLAWHIGNRHLDAQIEATRILIRRDHVIALMLEQLGASLILVTEPFSPEHGAYHGH